MNSTFFVGHPAPDSARLATPYRENYTAFDFVEAYEYYIPTAAGLFSTTGDLARFAAALSDDRLVGPSAREEMWTSVPFDETTIDAIKGYGIGWTVDQQDGHRRVWHSGGGKAAFKHYPDDALTVIFLTNRAGFDVVTPTAEIAALYLQTTKSDDTVLGCLTVPVPVTDGSRRVDESGQQAVPIPRLLGKNDWPRPLTSAEQC